jgi:sugar O-acyltransferase (sialic acid O-acetyltransferase NeuD family)
MEDDIKAITLEKFNASDDSYLVREIKVSSGQHISKGQVLVLVETSKSIIDVVSTHDGYFYHSLVINEKVLPGTEIGFIANRYDHALINKYSSKIMPVEEKVGLDIQPSISKKALALLEIHGLSQEIFSGKKNIKADDVLSYINANTNADIFSDVKITRISEIVILGGKGTAKMVIDAIRSNSQYVIKGLIDPDLKKGDELMGVPVLGGDEELEALRSQGIVNLVLAFTALDDLKSRYEKFIKLTNQGFFFPNIIHGKALVEPSSVMGVGNVILAGALVGSMAKLSHLNFVNTGAIVSHDANIGENNHFAPGSILAGRVTVGNHNLFGMGVTVFQDLSIESGNIVMNGVNIFSNMHSNQILKA